mmetsp:Transcript_10612/g.43993  ORF Transcript_10612/g.43993 Transcript_10612/m.43993 type:complete len:239 (+) Transcript_10612:4740-5456(+)
MSRTSGFTTRSSAKCRARSLTTPCSAGLAAARAGATGAYGGSPRRSAWNESMRTSRWYAGMCWRSAPFLVATPGTERRRAVSSSFSSSFSSSSSSVSTFSRSTEPSNSLPSPPAASASSSSSSSPESPADETLPSPSPSTSTSSSSVSDGSLRGSPPRSIAARITRAWYAAAANIPACCSGRCSVALCHQHTRELSTASSRSLTISSLNLPTTKLSSSPRVSSAAAVNSAPSSTDTTS